ncbi:MAG: hypothetical protein MJZ30_09185 [Paludibacteraceae bacterium]|nr:hypothetical protein [Paludibacteraceae bacterium]
MVFKFVLLSDEVDGFMREIHIDSDATFLELNDAILASVGYAKDQMTTFLVCNDDWEAEQEITLMEMDTASDVDSYVMDRVRIEEFASEEGQKLRFVFDILNERSFFMELKEVVTRESLPAPICKKSKGQAPVQVLDGLFLDIPEVKGTSSFDEDELGEFEGFDQYNEDEMGDFTSFDDEFGGGNM